MNMVSPEKVGFSPDRLRRMDRIMQGYADQNKVAGIVTLLARGGQVFQQGCYGMADREAGVPMQPDSLFRIWSMSKAVTAAATLILYEEGHFSLDQDIADFLPEFKDTKVFVEQVGDEMKVTDRERAITPRQLMSHTAGLLSGSPNHPVEKLTYERGQGLMRDPGTLANVVATIAETPLLFQPFTRWYYSLGLDVAARLVEVVSGQHYRDFLKQRILDPLGMKDTDFVVQDSQIDRFTALYRRDENGQLVLAEAPRDSLDYQLRHMETGTFYTPGGTGLVSSAPDYLRFAQMLLNKGELDGARILSPSTVTLMTSNVLPDRLLPCQFPNSEPIYGYGHGLGVHTLHDPGLAASPSARGEFWKDGGVGTLFFVDPTYDLVGIVFYQLFDFWMYPIFRQFRALAYQAMLD